MENVDVLLKQHSNFEHCIDQEDYNDGYYHIGKDIEVFPDAVIYIVWSRRGPGKTYSALRYPYHKFRTLYMKRTN